MFKRKLKKSIVFSASEEALETLPLPDRAARFIPSWYKTCPMYNEDYYASTIKRCIPFREALMNGFIIPLWHDAYFQFAKDHVGKDYLSCVQNRGAQRLALETDIGNPLPVEGVVSYHPSEQYADYATVDKKSYPNYAHVVKFHSPFNIQTPKGWSILIKPVPNDFSSPVVPFEAVVDTDRFFGKINFPCFIRSQDKEFSMPLGTPLAQIIPFKRERVNIKRKPLTKEDFKKMELFGLRFATVVHGQYKKFWWHRTQEHNEKR